MLLTLTGWNWI